MIDLMTIPADVRPLYDHIPRAADEDMGAAIAWLRKLIRPTAIEDAIRLAIGRPIYPHQIPPYGETMFLANNAVDRLGWTWREAEVAARAEWVDAQEKVRKLQEDIRRAVWPMAKVRSSGIDMIAAADRACQRADIVLPPEFVTDLCRRIAKATVTKRAYSK